jgi:hypothetical protein
MASPKSAEPLVLEVPASAIESEASKATATSSLPTQASGN